MQGAQGVQAVTMNQMMKEKTSFWASQNATNTRHREGRVEGRVNCTKGMYQSFKCKCKLFNLQSEKIKINSVHSAVHTKFTAANTGWERLIRSHSSARNCFEFSGNSNQPIPCNSNLT